MPGEKVPAKHWMQPVDPVMFEKDPGVQLEHEEDPFTTEIVPAGHCVQALALALE